MAAKDATHVRNSSLLPDPVVPPTRAWGPSVARSAVTVPLPLTPMGAAKPLALCEAFQRRAIALAIVFGVSVVWGISGVCGVWGVSGVCGVFGLSDKCGEMVRVEGPEGVL